MALSFAATNIQLGLLLHAGVVMVALKLSARLNTCAVPGAIENVAAPVGRSPSYEVLMKLRGVKVSETVRRLLDRRRLTEVTWETLSEVSFILSCIWHVGSDVDQTGDRCIRPRFGNDGSSSRL